MINNYFLLYHSAEFKPSVINLLLNTNDENFDEVAAFFLSLSQEKLKYFIEFDEFKKLSKKIIINGFLDSSTLFEFSYIVLERIMQNQNLQKKYLDTFSYLHDIEFINTQEKDTLETIFEIVSTNTSEESYKNHNFLDAKKHIELSMSEVKKLLESEELLDSLDLLNKYLHKKVFSIGITGVMNVGKSTFINALLGEEILGSSVVAETANLSVLKYAQKPYAKVNFFNTVEFEELLHTAEVKINEKLDLKRYIKDETFSLDIKQNELQTYTSASSEYGFSDIVKNVELGVSLEFLKDSVEIVDTPGLDDSLILRETITKVYVESCDLLIHLMNVNQSATQKDVDFIVATANNKNLSGILILLTKADNITDKELVEVQTYTKKTILNQVTSAIPIEFLSISATTKVGIEKVKEYLHHTLFDKSTKNEMMLKNVESKFKSIIESQMNSYDYMLLLYSKDEDSLELELREFNNIKEKNKLIIKKLNLKIDEEFKLFTSYIDTLDSDMINEIDTLKNKLLGRVVDELRYSFKNKVKIKERQILMLIDKSINHGYIDIIREYQYKLKKYMLNISKKIELDFSQDNIIVKQSTDEDFMSKLFEQNSSSTLNTNIKIISKKANSIIHDAKESKIDKFTKSFLNILDGEFIYISKNINLTKSELNNKNLDSFSNSLREPLNKLELEMNEREKIISTQIYAIQNSDEDMQKNKISILHKTNALNQILKSIS